MLLVQELCRWEVNWRQLKEPPAISGGALVKNGCQFWGHRRLGEVDDTNRKASREGNLENGNDEVRRGGGIGWSNSLHVHCLPVKNCTWKSPLRAIQPQSPLCCQVYFFFLNRSPAWNTLIGYTDFILEEWIKRWNNHIAHKRIMKLHFSRHISRKISENVTKKKNKQKHKKAAN